MLYVSVCPCVSKKNKKLAGFQWWRWRMYLFWFWNTMWNLLGAPLVFVYLHMHTVVCFSKTLHKHKAHYLAGKSGSWLVSYQSIFIVLIKINTSVRGFITTVPWILKDFQGRVVYLWPVFCSDFQKMITMNVQQKQILSYVVFWPNLFLHIAVCCLYRKYRTTDNMHASISKTGALEILIAPRFNPILDLPLI